MKSQFKLINIEKKTLMEIGVYLCAVMTVAFAFVKSNNDLSNVGKRAIAQTLDDATIKMELAKLAPLDVKLETYLATVNLLISHGRIAEAKKLLIKRLKHVRAQNSKADDQEQIALLQVLATTNVKLMHFEDAQLILQEAAKIAKASNNQKDQIVISSDLIALYLQYSKFSSTELQRQAAERLFNSEVEHLNKIAASYSPDAKTQRLIHNRHQIGLIEMNRFLELDNFDPEPGTHGPI